MGKAKFIKAAVTAALTVLEKAASDCDLVKFVPAFNATLSMVGLPGFSGAKINVTCSDAVTVLEISSSDTAIAETAGSLITVKLPGAVSFVVTLNDTTSCPFVDKEIFSPVDFYYISDTPVNFSEEAVQMVGGTSAVGQYFKDAVSEICVHAHAVAKNLPASNWVQFPSGAMSVVTVDPVGTDDAYKNPSFVSLTSGTMITAADLTSLNVAWGNGLYHHLQGIDEYSFESSFSFWVSDLVGEIHHQAPKVLVGNPWVWGETNRWLASNPKLEEQWVDAAGRNARVASKVPFVLKAEEVVKLASCPEQILELDVIPYYELSPASPFAVLGSLVAVVGLLLVC